MYVKSFSFLPFLILWLQNLTKSESEMLRKGVLPLIRVFRIKTYQKHFPIMFVDLIQGGRDVVVCEESLNLVFQHQGTLNLGILEEPTGKEK